MDYYAMKDDIFYTYNSNPSDFNGRPLSTVCKTPEGRSVLHKAMMQMPSDTLYHKRLQYWINKSQDSRSESMLGAKASKIHSDKSGF